MSERYPCWSLGVIVLPSGPEPLKTRCLNTSNVAQKCLFSDCSTEQLEVLLLSKNQLLTLYRDGTEKAACTKISKM